MTGMRTIGIVLALALLAAPARAAEVEVPVTKVTSFSAGVAYYEHNGSVKDNAEVSLKFKTGEMNDVLMSLVVMDLGGKGGVSGVSYASQEPLSRALKSFGIDISGDPALWQVLAQLRGSEVTVLAPESVTGKILSVETRTRQLVGPPPSVITEHVLSLITDKGIRSLVLEQVNSVALTNERLNDELNKALALLVDSRDTNRKTVSVNFTGAGERPVRIGYVNESPIWKTSYRLVINEAPQDKAKPVAIAMQGWAIVENTSDFDWKQVDLTLVSGRPISFIQDLYTPLFVPRQMVQPELYASLRPPIYEEGLSKEKFDRADVANADEMKRADGRLGANAKGAFGGAPGGPTGGMAPAASAAKPAEDDSAGYLRRGVASVAQAASVGELFSYHIKDKVSIPRRKSAMLPIINQDVEARKVSIYNASTLAKHPLNGLWLTNNTGLSLLAGPVTLFDGGTYAGDARLDNLSPGEKRLLSYAIDLDVAVDSTTKNAQSIVAVQINRGVLTLSRRHEFRQTYAIKNKSEKARTLVIEHPFNSSRKLVKPAEALEKTSDVYRFEVAVEPKKTVDFEVVEEQIVAQGIEILPGDVGTFQVYLTNQEIPQKIKDALVEAIKRKSELVLAERKLAELKQQIAQLTQEQARIRANMAAVKDGSTAYQRFEKDLLTTDDQIKQLTGQVAEQQGKADQLRKDLEDYLGKLNVQ